MKPSHVPRLAPYFAVKDAPKLIRFLEAALDGRLTFEEKSADGLVSHAEVRVADSLVMIAEASSSQSPFPSRLHLYVESADASYDWALRAGATSVRPPADSPDGTRRGGVRDPWGSEWWFSNRTR
jgi:PhnB protein